MDHYMEKEKNIFVRAIEKIQNILLMPGTEYEDNENTGDAVNAEPRIRTAEPATRPGAARGHDRGAATTSTTAPRDGASAGWTRSSDVLKLVGEAAAINYNEAECIVLAPNDMDDAAQVCDYIKTSKLCAINMMGLDRTLAQRIMDFINGATYLLGGEITTVSNDIYIIAPRKNAVASTISSKGEADVAARGSRSFLGRGAGR